MQGRLEPCLPALFLAFCGSIEAVAEQVEKDPRHLLGRHLDWREPSIELALHGDVEARILGASTVIRKVQRLIDEPIEVHRTAFAADAARVLQHALDDAVGALAVLGDLAEIAGQHLDRLINLGPRVVVERGDGATYDLRTLI